MFTKNSYINRRKKLAETINGGLLVFLGNDESPMNYPDNPFHFRQDSTFIYYFGLNKAHLSAVIDLDNGEEIIFGNELTIDDIIWMGTQPSLKEQSEAVGIDKSQPFNQFKTRIETAKSKNQTIRYLPQYRMENMVLLGDLLNLHPSQVNEGADIEFIKAVVAQRNIKSADEVVEIEKAVNTTVDMHLAAMKLAAPGMTEAQIAAAVHQVALEAGGNLAFPIIATTHGEILHNHYHGHTLKKGDMFLLDAGAETRSCYAGDMSSTIPVDKTFTPRQKQIYQITIDAHEAAIKALKPGTKFIDVHLTACKTIAAGLKELGLMKGNIDEAVAAGAHTLFFPCGTGHMMGLDVHDMENLGEQYVGYEEGMTKSTQFGLKSLRLARELLPGFVLTIEPGIYFIPELIDLWKRENRYTDFINYAKVESYKDFGGIRNEENFLITPAGYRLLGKPLPKFIEDVEALR